MLPLAFAFAQPLNTSLRAARHIFVGAALSLSASGIAAAEGATDDMDVVTVLSAMSNAMQTLNYEGTFVHIQNGNAELMHVLHASGADGESERMRSLNGEAREIIRNNSLVTCIWPGSDDVIVNKSKPRTLLKPLDASLVKSGLYGATSGGSDRVAGIAANVINVNPADDFRYGYRFWVDQNTGMMLRSMVLDSRDRPIEELMFTAIEYPNEINAARFEIDVDVERTQWIQSKGNSDTSLKPAVNKVSFNNLPKGYDERSESLRMMAVRKDGPVSHVVVSDGIATVSVYVEYVARKNHDQSALGSTSIGAVNAFGLSLPNALVTAVGEVPSKTVESIARAATLNP